MNDIEERIKELEEIVGFTEKDRENYQLFWKIPDAEFPEKWLEKLEMHAFPKTAPKVIFDIAPWDSFVSPSTGRVIHSKAQRREDMKASGCRNWEGLDSEKRAAHVKKKEIEKEDDKKITEAAHRAYAQLSPKDKKILLNS